MWSRMPTVAVGAAVLALALFGCTSQEAPPQQTPSGWAGAPSAGLSPSGMALAGDGSSSAWASGRIVVDGTGMAWVDGPWSLTRVDPATGTGMTFDVEDDSAFGYAGLTDPSAGPGAWLVGLDRAQLFDGQRFAADLELPADVVRADADEATSVVIVDGLEVGSELWLSILYIRTGADGQQSGRVVRWSGGTWSPMSERRDGVGGSLAVDRDGAVWAAGFDGPFDGATSSVRRWDGEAWVIPAADDPQLPGAGGVVVADPTEGVWILSREGQSAVLSRFDGAGWDQVSPDVREHVGARVTGLSDGGADGLAAAPGGAAWATGSDGAALFDPDGTVRTFGADQGVEVAEGGTPLDVAVAGDDVLLRGGPTVLRLEGSGFEPLWRAATDGSVHMRGLAAVSADEVWNRIAVSTAAGGNRESRWARFSGGAWNPVGPRVTGMGSSAVASDGALWATTAEGLVRYSGQDWEVIAPDVRQATSRRESIVVAGADGSAWASVDGDVVGFRPDGTRTTIGRPEGMESAVPRAAGADGTVWTSEAGTSALSRWDGRWSAVELPDADASVYDMVVTADGALWAQLQLPSGGLLGRYDQGVWTTPASGAGGSLVAAPHDAVCVPINPRGGIDCYDADGLVGTIPFDGFFDEFDIAADGATWVNGQLIVRLAGTAPPG